uniref:Glucuronosyltransferase n=1 Tax=Panagrolaimus sp. JU765 TaxID=591449 RepID=A0AC34Q0S4_9BILA
MARISDLLVSSGHNVTFFQTIFDAEGHPSYETLAQKVIVHHPTGVDPNFIYNFDYRNEKMFQRKEQLYFTKTTPNLLKLSLEQCRGLIGDSITTNLRNEQFDLIIFEQIDLCSGLWLQYLEVDKMIATSSYGTAPIMEYVSGLNPNPSFVPCKFLFFVGFLGRRISDCPDVGFPT